MENDDISPVLDTGVAMFRRAAVHGLPKLSRADRAAFRHNERVVERELAAYSSDADRNDLQALIDASITSAAWKVSGILSGQAYRRLHQAH
jgi:hypothetical protein